MQCDCGPARHSEVSVSQAACNSQWHTAGHILKAPKKLSWRAAAPIGDLVVRRWHAACSMRLVTDPTPAQDNPRRALSAEARRDPARELRNPRSASEPSQVWLGSNKFPAARSSLGIPSKGAAHLQRGTLKAVVTPPSIDHDVSPLLLEGAVEWLNLQGTVRSVNFSDTSTTGCQHMPPQPGLHIDKASSQATQGRD